MCMRPASVHESSWGSSGGAGEEAGDTVQRSEGKGEDTRMTAGDDVRLGAVEMVAQVPDGAVKGSTNMSPADSAFLGAAVPFKLTMQNFSLIMGSKKARKNFLVNSNQTFVQNLFFCLCAANKPVQDDS